MDQAPTPTADRPGPPPEAEADEPLPIVLTLVQRLAEAGITYCHWKSNEALGRSLSAENDLDLLVARADAARFNAVLHDLGYLVARPSASRHVTGMVDHYRLDDASGRMVHVQAHYGLVLGDDTTKNFRLPIEDEYLASCSIDRGVPVPEPALEFLVFLLRMVVKHCPWDAQLARRGRLGLSERRELVYLAARTDPARLEQLRAIHTPFVSSELLERCRRSVERTSSRVSRMRTGRELLQTLDSFGRTPARRDLVLRVQRRARRRREGSGPASRRKLDSGGLFVAIVGGDGSGKSSAVAALDVTFSRHFPTHVVHLGKPPRSLATRAVMKGLRVWASVTGRPSARPDPWTDWTQEPFPGLGFVLRHTLIARDRHRAFLAARRKAGRGWLVVSDRLPLEGITCMDSPRCANLPGLRRRPLSGWLAAREAGYYREITSPDLLLVLRVDPETAVARRHDQDAEFVRRRAEEVWGHDWSTTMATVIDASQDQEQVLTELHRRVWSAL